MNKLCVDIDQLGGVLELPADDPRRRHVETCPRCSALAVTYRDFVNAEPVPDSDPEAAAVHLRGVLREEIEGALASRAKARSSFFSLRPAWAALAVVLVVGSVVLIRMGPEGPQEQVLRGGGTGEEPLSLAAPEFENDGSVRLSWRPLDEADQYLVVIYEPDLTELTRTDPVIDPEIVLYPRDLVGAASGSAVIWRVVALQGGDEIQLSAPGTLLFP
jgi:hypothetical protein